jgi:hypothetical protein
MISTLTQLLSCLKAGNIKTGQFIQQWRKQNLLLP